MQIEELKLAPHVRACESGDWLILLDLVADRYWALPSAAPRAKIEAQLASRGLLAGCVSETPSALRAYATPAARVLPDAVLIVANALWAASIVKRGKLSAAFAWMARHKPATHGASTARVRSAFAGFSRVRCWLPWRYVCLFNALCLARFLVERGYRVDLVFGVRGRPFAAHCWVEANGAILDSGGEDCSSFNEIARV